MKKIVCFLLCTVLAYAGIAQAGISGTLKSQYNLTVDTVTNTATKYVYTARVAGFSLAGVVVNLTEISGTTAGTITLEASQDNVTWYSAYYSTDTTYSFTATDVATQSFRFKVVNFIDNYLRVKYVGSGTMSTKIAGTWTARRQ